MTRMTRPLVLLDRDGVLDALVVDPEHGVVDSPLHPDQVSLLPGVPEALVDLERLGFGLAIVTNQPAAAKGTTTRANLEAVHARVVGLAQAAGARIGSSHICYHRREDHCQCRKPGTALLEEALVGVPPELRARSWMVGDGVSDVEAGQRAGLRTAFLGPPKVELTRIFGGLDLRPDFWGADLPAFAAFAASLDGASERR